MATAIKKWAAAKARIPGAGVSRGVSKADAIQSGHKATDKAEATRAAMGSSAPEREKGHAAVAKAHEEAAKHYERAGAKTQADAARAKAAQHTSLSAKAAEQSKAGGGGAWEEEKHPRGEGGKFG